MKDAESVRNQQQQHVQQYSCTLDECFQLYTKEEQVVSQLSCNKQRHIIIVSFNQFNIIPNTNPNSKKYSNLQVPFLYILIYIQLNI